MLKRSRAEHQLSELLFLGVWHALDQMVDIVTGELSHDPSWKDVVATHGKAGSLDSAGLYRRNLRERGAEKHVNQKRPERPSGTLVWRCRASSSSRKKPTHMLCVCINGHHAAFRLMLKLQQCNHKRGSGEHCSPGYGLSSGLLLLLNCFEGLAPSSESV